MTTCLICGCSDHDACIEDGEACHWIVREHDQGICSRSTCVARAQELGWIDGDDADDNGNDAGDELLHPSRELILPGDPDFHL